MVASIGVGDSVVKAALRRVLQRVRGSFCVVIHAVISVGMSVLNTAKCKWSELCRYVVILFTWTVTKIRNTICVTRKFSKPCLSVAILLKCVAIKIPAASSVRIDARKCLNVVIDVPTSAVNLVRFQVFRCQDLEIYRVVVGLG